MWRAFGAECGSGVLTPDTGGPPGPKNMLGSNRPLCTRPGSLPLRASNPPNGVKKPLAEMSRSATEHAASALPEISNHNDVGLVIAGAGFDPCLPLAHLVGSSHVCVPVSSRRFPDRGTCGSGRS